MVLSIKGSDEFVTSSAASIATGQATLPRRDFHPLKHTRIHGARTFYFVPCHGGLGEVESPHGGAARASVGGVCYHVLNRGNARQKVFRKEEDFAAFLELIEQAKERLPMRLLA